MRAEQIEKAIRLIIESCSEDRIITENFDTLLEIAKGTDSEFSPLIIEIIKDRGLDMKYLSDGASFLISRLYFSNDYYKVLGLRQDATPSDIKKRWRDLIELYHPDRYGNTEYTEERAKRVNEAYSILKDREKRKEYDERLLKELSEGSFGQAKAPKPTTSEMKTLRAKKRVPSREFFIFGIPFSELRHKIPRYITAFYIAASFLFLLFIFLKYYPMDSEPPKTTIQPEVKEKETSQKDITPIFPDLSSPSSQHPPVTENQSTGSFGTSVTPQPQEQKKQSRTDREEVRTGALITHKTAVTQKPPVQKTLPVDQAPTQSKVLSGPKDPVEQKDKITRDIQSEGSYGQERPINFRETIVAKEIGKQESPVVVAPFTNIPTPEETKAFISDYIAIYEKGDIERFMTLFSRSAIENDAIDYNGIHHIYARTFEGKKNKYQITSLEIRPMEYFTLVSGIYYIERLTLSTGQKIKGRGKINWRLIKEDGEIKILRADYKGQ